jgi:hypothetical protein
MCQTKMVQAIHAFLEFCYIARHDIHDTNSLAALDDALQRFHHHREIFRTSSICDGFNLLRQHDKVRCTLGGGWSHLGSPQMVQPNMPSILGLLSVTAQFGIPRALRLTHLVAFQPLELCGCGFMQ